MSNDHFAPFGIADAEVEAILERASSGAATDEDRAKIAAMVEVLNEALPQAIAVMDDLLTFFPFSIFDFSMLIPPFNEWLAEQGITARLRMEPYPSYRTEPIPGVELGGKTRNPEADVIDEIDRLVDWQIEKGQR